MNKEEWKKLLIYNCQEVGTFQETFLPVIETLAQILEQRDQVHEQYVKEGSHPTITRHTERSGEKNTAKNPLLMIENDLNAQALAFFRQLGLTPKGLKELTSPTVNESKTTAGLEQLLTALNE